MHSGCEAGIRRSGGNCVSGFTGLRRAEISLWGVRRGTHTDGDDFCLADRQVSTLSSGSGL